MREDPRQQLAREIGETIRKLEQDQIITWPDLVQYRQYHDAELRAGRTPEINMERARAHCPELASMAAQELGRRGGAATKGISTPAKTAAARRNAKLGGRPRSDPNKYYEAGEQTTAWNAADGLVPNRVCDHRHATETAADRCAAKNYPWTTYVVVDGKRFRALEHK